MSEEEKIKIQTIQKLIEQNFAQKLTIEELSREAGLSETKLKLCFKEYSNISIHQFQIQHRLQKAVYLLKKSNLTIQEIAIHIGYNSVSHFTHIFRTHFKQTPSEYRSN